VLFYSLCRIEAFFVVRAGVVAGIDVAIGHESGAGWRGEKAAPQDTTQEKGEAALAAGREHLAAGRWQSAIDAFMTALGYRAEQ